MKITILQFMLRAEEQVFKKLFEKLARGVNAFLQIVVVGADESSATLECRIKSFLKKRHGCFG